MHTLRLYTARHRRRPQRKPRQLWAVLILSALLASLAFLGAGAAGIGTAYAMIIRDLPSPTKLSEEPVAQRTVVYDRNGQELFEFYEERRIVVPLSQISPAMILATLGAEDVHFYAHPGLDLRGVIRAAMADLRHQRTVQGGSTITQQLVKSALLRAPERTFERKLRELVLALQVETVYTKDQILEMYLNHVFYGNQAYGVEAAAQNYFGKSAKDLNLAEATLLAGVPAAPSVYAPTVNWEAARQRQRSVLDTLVRWELITPEQAEEAWNTPIQLVPRTEAPIKAPHFVFYVKQVLEQRFGPEVVRRGGLRVFTTLDMEMQQLAETVVRERVAALARQRVNNSALVAIRPQTGEILAMVGSVDYFNKAIDGQVNVALAERQPGSSFKPYTYATAFATGKWTPATRILDAPVTYRMPEGPWSPKNYDRYYHGWVTLRRALANSYNVPAVKLAEQVGIQDIIKTARDLGITSDLPPVLSLTLGSGGVRLLEHTGAYAVFANGGVRVDPTPLLKVVDARGRVIYELKPQGRQVISPEVAYLISDILSDANARRPAFGNALDLKDGRIAAVKTGTTDDWKDSWTMGYTPDLVVGVWMGNTRGEQMQQVPGSLGAASVWKEFMNRVLEGQPNKKFEQPEGVVRVWLCISNGLLASWGCPSYQEVFIKGTQPTRYGGTPPPPPAPRRDE